jgi:hypothetical protein
VTAGVPGVRTGDGCRGVGARARPEVVFDAICESTSREGLTVIGVLVGVVRVPVRPRAVRSPRPFCPCTGSDDRTPSRRQVVVAVDDEGDRLASVTVEYNCFPAAETDQ